MPREIIPLRAEGRDRELLDAADEVLLDHRGAPARQARLPARARGGARARRARARRADPAAGGDTAAGQLAPTLRAHALRFRARLAARNGDALRAEAGFVAAAAILLEFGMPFLLAVALTHHAEWLVSEDQRHAEPLLAEAHETFERLNARPWLERVEAAAQARPRARAQA